MSPYALDVGRSKSDDIDYNSLVAHRGGMAVGNVVDLHKIDPSMLADTLDGLATGIFLVDGSRRVVYANASGHAMLAEGDVVHMAGVRLGTNDVQAEQLLRDAFTAAGSGDPVGVKRMAVLLSASGGQRYVAHILPLTPGASQQAGNRYSAVAAILVQKATICEAVAFEAIARCFNLTPAELRVLFAVVKVGGVPEMAPALGISETTVKTHLQRLFEKTGTKRQAELVKLAAGFVSPLSPHSIPSDMRELTAAAV